MVKGKEEMVREICQNKPSCILFETIIFHPEVSIQGRNLKFLQSIIWSLFQLVILIVEAYY